jgi:hypothetical protein
LGIPVIIIAVFITVRVALVIVPGSRSIKTDRLKQEEETNRSKILNFIVHHLIRNFFNHLYKIKIPREIPQTRLIHAMG